MITSGIDIATVLPVLIQRKGWRQPTQTGSPTLTTSNKTCLSGKYFQDHHAACTIDAYKSAQEDPKISDADLNAALEASRNTACLDALNAVFTQPVCIDKPRLAWEKIDYTQLVTIPNENKFVAAKISLATGAYAAQIHSVALLFNGVATFNIYLFHNLTVAPVWSQQVTTVANTQTVIPLDNKIIRYMDNTYKGGFYFLGYFQNDLGSVQALRPAAYITYNPKIYGVQYISAVANDTHTDFTRYPYQIPYNTYGLNPIISTYRDFSDTVIQRANEFDELIGDLMAASVIEKSIYTARTNAAQRINQDNNLKLYTDLNQDGPTENSPYGYGLRRKIKNRIKTLQDTFNPPKGFMVTRPGMDNDKLREYPGSVW